ncbi:hypothetical protein vBAbaPP1_161 [Acinetobacter phage vB_AbaM_P1]|nr:hypothetical protein vBAbaPP1_161 [Acinetobacter phage vB_AbaM_P1]WAX22643.1 hypothetical protein [Acinetobacter phage vB_AbaP_HB01]
MSHFGIDPIAAKKFWDDTPIHIDADTITRNHVAMCEKFHRDMMLHDAYFYGLFPSAENERDKEYLDAWAFVKDIHRKYADVIFMEPKKMPDVGTIGHPEEPCLNELTRLIRGGIAKDELCVVVGKPSTATALRPEVIEMYKSRRQNGTGMLVALEDTKDSVIKRFEKIMGNTVQQSRRF